MTTLLTHIWIKPGKEEKWEGILKTMASATHEHEEGVVRYEYWKGQEPNFWYCLLSFRDKEAFYHHQMSEHHETQDFADVIADIRLEYVDPVQGGGSGLARTEDPPLPDDATDDQRTAQERYPISIADWWKGRA